MAKIATITVHVDPDGKAGWVVYNRRKMPAPVTVVFRQRRLRPRQFRVPRRYRRYIYIVATPFGLQYRLPRRLKGRVRVILNCGGAGVP